MFLILYYSVYVSVRRNNKVFDAGIKTFNFDKFRSINFEENSNQICKTFEEVTIKTIYDKNSTVE